MQQFQQSEATAARRRFPVYLVDATDGITPETGEGSGQPQISKNGGAFANTSATLTAIGNGAYYVELTAAELDTLGFINVRYKSANTVEFNIPAQVAAYDPYASNLGLNDLSESQVNAQVDTALADIGLDHLTSTATGIPAITSGTFLDQIMRDGTASYDRTTDSLQAIRDRGDAAWTTGGGGSISDLLNIIPLVPPQIDLANTATWRLGLMLVNTVDDLPTTAEIDPGTVSVDRKAAGATSWSAVVTDAACSELAGLVYYDEVFDSGTGYAEGDSIRVTFKSQKITVAANDYEISDSNGRVFYSTVREQMRGTDSALLASGVPTNFSSMGIEADGHVHADVKEWLGSTVNALISGRVDSSTGAMAAAVLTAAALATDAVQEIRDAITGGAYALDTDANGRVRIVDGIGAGELDTASGLIAGIAGTKNTLDDLTDITEAQVSTQMEDSLNVDTRTLPGQEAPTATPTFVEMVTYLYKAFRNKTTQSTTEFSVFADNGTTVDQKSTVSDDGTTFTRGELGTGP